MEMQILLLVCMAVTVVFGEVTNNTVFFTNRSQSSSSEVNNPEISGGDYAAIKALPSCPGNMTPGPFIDELDNFSRRCQCNSKFLYFPLSESCYEVYTRGPCPPGQYVHQSSVHQEVGRCIKDPCVVDGLVPHNNSCYTLETNDGPCSPPSVLSIESSTFRIICRDNSEDLLTHYESVSVLEVPKKVHKQSGPPCPPGKKRAKNGACMTVWKKARH